MIHDLENESLRIEVKLNAKPAPIEVNWYGRSNSRNPGKVLDPYLVNLVGLASDDERSVEMHFEDLHYLNSSTVSSLIRFIREAKAKDLVVRLVYDPSRAWQRMSFDALRIFADDGQLVLSPAALS
jgi:hypothetical protein